MLFVGFYYYENEKNSFHDLVKSNMHAKAAKLSTRIIYLHMINQKLNVSTINNDKNYSISLYSAAKKKIYGKENHKIIFEQDFYKNKNNYVLVDNSSIGHLGIFYIIVEENLIVKKTDKLLINIIVFFLFIYSIIGLIGFYLAKLFLRPIKEEREKLNNFIKDTTHELNTPIAAILMSTESDELSDKQVQRVRLSAKRVSEVYKDLTYIFLQNHDNKKNIQVFNLSILMNEQLEYFKPLAIKKRINIKLALDNSSFLINKDDFIRLFNNIVSNAIKYNKRGGSISISLKNNVLCIKDSGIGISKNKIEDIYKRYYRATNEQGGFGIGLSIVNHICKTYNIKIEVKSEEKVGTSFLFTFKN